MFALRAELKKRGLIRKDLNAAFVEIRRGAMEDTGTEFHTNYLGLRFTVGGARYLNYERRSPKYEKRKLKRFGHQKPLVWSGASEILATGIRDVRPAANQKTSSVRVVLHSRGLNRNNPKSSVRMSDEVRRIHPNEEKKLTAFYGDAIQRRSKAMDQ